MPNAHIYVGLGSNVGDRAGYLLLALRGLFAAGLGITRLSSVYETEPVDVHGQPPFLNMIAEVNCDPSLSAEQVMAQLLRVESALGRKREASMGPRTIDLDLLLYKDETSGTQFLTLPHPRLHLRRFVLVPLAELAPGLVHPTLHRTIEELLENLADQSEVKFWPP